MDKYIGFLNWLSNRLVYRHNYSIDDDIIVSINNLCTKLKQGYVCELSDDQLELIISKYYVDFFLDPSEDFKVGFSDEERNQLRHSIRCIINDAINNRIPKEPLIKGN